MKTMLYVLPHPKDDPNLIVGCDDPSTTLGKMIDAAHPQPLTMQEEDEAAKFLRESFRVLPKPESASAPES